MIVIREREGEEVRTRLLTRRQNKNSLELLNIIFENSSPKGSFGANKKKIEFSLLSPDSRKLLTTALKQVFVLNSTL